MIKINNISINLVELPQTGGVKTFSVTGEPGAKFILIVSNSTGDYYNFTTKLFSSGHGPEKMLKGTLAGNSFEGSIVFPSAAGASYDILLVPDPTNGTEMKRGKPINKRLKQLGDTTLTLSLATEGSSFYNTLPSDLVITNSPTAAPSSTAISWTIVNITSNVDDGFGSGFDLDGTTFLNNITDSAWYFVTTGTIDGAISASSSVVVDSVDGLFEGMSITSGLSGFSGLKPIVQKIDLITKTLFLDKACNGSDGATLTFNGYGLTNISKAIGASIVPNIKPNNFVIPTTTVRGAVNNSTTITVNGTYGINGQDHYNTGSGFTEPTTFSGLNSTPGIVQSVTASETAGSFVADIAQTFKGGEKLTFGHIDRNYVHVTSFTLEGSILVNSQPSSNQTIYLDLDKFVTTGLDN